MFKILSIDDEEDILSFLKELIEKDSSFYVDSCTSATLAEMLCKDTAYDVILADFKMPGMNGSQLVKKIREEGFNKESPIIFISAYIEKAEEETSTYKNIHYMDKLVDVGSVVSKIKEVVGKKS